jgi:hypothetical protein
MTTQTSHVSRDWEVLRFGTLPTATESGRAGRVLRSTTSQGTGFGIFYPTSGLLNLPLRDLSVWIKDTDLDDR